RGAGGLGPFHQDGPQRNRIRDDAGVRGGLLHPQAQGGVLAGPAPGGRDLAHGERGALVAPRPHLRRAGQEPGHEGHCAVRGRFRRGALDGGRGDRPRRARARHHALAPRAAALARRGLVLRQAPRRDEERIRRPRHQEGMSDTRWIPAADAGELRRAGFKRIVDAAGRAIAARGAFAISLAGGNTPRGVYAMLREADTDWALWHIYYGDERCVSRGDPERNSRMARDAWLDHVPIPAANIHEIPAELGADAGAAAYAKALKGLGDFDLTLLGLGEDGHTASLFPGHEWGDSFGSPGAIAVFDAPKLPSERVSLSAARL